LFYRNGKVSLYKLATPFCIGGKIKMEMEEIVKILIFVVVLVVMVGAFILFSGKGGDLIEGIRNVLRFGK